MKTETCLNDVFITIKDDTLIIEGKKDYYPWELQIWAVAWG